MTDEKFNELADEAGELFFEDIPEGLLTIILVDSTGTHCSIQGTVNVNNLAYTAKALKESHRDMVEKHPELILQAIMGIANQRGESNGGTEQTVDDIART